MRARREARMVSSCSPCTNIRSAAPHSTLRVSAAQEGASDHGASVLFALMLLLLLRLNIVPC